MVTHRFARSALLLSTLLLLASSGPGGARDGGTVQRKENLDLPYDAVGGEEAQEEVAPEVILFHGGVYEADAVVFCLDESKSMAKFDRWNIQIREISRAIHDLNSRTEFGVVFYGAGAYAFRPNLVPGTPGNKSAALAFLQSRQMSLGTCLGPGVIKSLDLLSKSTRKHRAVIVAGDGRPTTCPFIRGKGRLSDAEIEKLLGDTVRRNPGQEIRLHTIYVGADQDPGASDFMKQLAERHRGTYRASRR